ncbi:hypothetical protein [Umezawaea sp. NPDC059074]|uniref:DUF7178 family protein n=1 Tax=Umezawaea sp. NPDC059074 TaxID=3346716 RepID=UPI00368C9587
MRLILMRAPGDHQWFQDNSLSVENIVDHWDLANSGEVERGMRWYADARRVARTIANGDAQLGAGMLAVYSPQQGWAGNILNASRVLKAGKGIGGPGSGIFASTSQKIAADRLLAGEPYDNILTGPKVRDFAHLIEHGGDHDAAAPRVVIDRHALSVACGRALTDAEYGGAPLGGSRRKDGSITRRLYDHVVSFYVAAARAISEANGENVAAHQVQAVTWLVRQRLNQKSEQRRGLTTLERGRTRARINAELAWDEFRANHFPDLAECPGTGYLPAA